MIKNLVESIPTEDRNQLVKDLISDFSGHSLLGVGVWVTGHRIGESELASAVVASRIHTRRDPGAGRILPVSESQLQTRTLARFP